MTTEMGIDKKRKVMYKELMAKTTPMEKVFNKAGIFFCMLCKKGFYNDEDLVSIKNTGACLGCDHIEGEKIYSQDLPF